MSKRCWAAETDRCTFGHITWRTEGYTCLWRCRVSVRTVPELTRRMRSWLLLTWSWSFDFSFDMTSRLVQLNLPDFRYIDLTNAKKGKKKQLHFPFWYPQIRGN
jgi:hypothetical protein